MGLGVALGMGLVLVLAVPEYARGCDPVQAAKLTADDGAEWDLFGNSVSVSGDITVVGAIYDDDCGDASGSAYVFERVGGVWVQTVKLTANDGAAHDNFGNSVSVSGDTAIVGAVYDWVHGIIDSGSAYVFEKIDGVWVQTAKLTANDGAAHDNFGHSVSISGDTAVIGMLKDDDKGTDSGSAYVFEKIDGVWTQVAKIVADDAVPGGRFGWSVAVSGDTAVVGAELDDDNGENSGSVYVFEKVSGVWTQTVKITAGDGAEDDSFGWSVSVSSDTAVVGAVYDGDNYHGEDSGSAYVFDLNCGCPGDLDSDGDTDIADLAILLAAYEVDASGDLDGDGDTDLADLAMLLADYGCGTGG